MARTTNLHEAAELLTPSNELSNIMRREQLLIDMPWKQGLLSITELCFDPRARAGLGLQDASALNGKCARVQSFVQERNRYNVIRVAVKTSIWYRPTNYWITIKSRQ